MSVGWLRLAPAILCTDARVPVPMSNPLAADLTLGAIGHIYLQQLWADEVAVAEDQLNAVNSIVAPMNVYELFYHFLCLRPATAAMSTA